MISQGVDNDDDDGTVFQPSTSPPLTGTLVLCLIRGMEPTTHRLLALPSGVRFRRLECIWYLEEDLRCIKAAVQGCSDTIECVDIECANPGKSHSFNLFLLRTNNWLTLILGQVNHGRVQLISLRR